MKAFSNTVKFGCDIQSQHFPYGLTCRHHRTSNVYNPLVKLYSAYVSRDGSDEYMVYLLAKDITLARKAYAVYMPWLKVRSVEECGASKAVSVLRDYMNNVIISTVFNVSYLPDELIPSDEEFMKARETCFGLVR